MVLKNLNEIEGLKSEPRNERREIFLFFYFRASRVETSLRRCLHFLCETGLQFTNISINNATHRLLIRIT